jgi:hypothetical protein
VRFVDRQDVCFWGQSMVPVMTETGWKADIVSQSMTMDLFGPLI